MLCFDELIAIFCPVISNFTKAHCITVSIYSSNITWYLLVWEWTSAELLSDVYNNAIEYMSLCIGSTRSLLIWPDDFRINHWSNYIRINLWSARSSVCNLTKHSLITGWESNYQRVKTTYSTHTVNHNWSYVEMKGTTSNTSMILTSFLPTRAFYGPAWCVEINSVINVFRKGGDYMRVYTNHHQFR